MKTTKKQLDKPVTESVLKKELKKVDKRMDGFDKRMDGFDKRMDKMTLDIIEIKEDMKNMVTRDEFNEKMDVVIGMLEESAKRDKKYEAESVANLGAHNRIQEDVNEVRTHVKMPIKNKVLS